MKIFMPNLALFRQTLMTDAWSMFTYFLRFVLVSGVLLALAVFYYEDLRFSTVSAVGRNFFEAVAMFNAIGLTVVGLTVFSSALTTEKEDGTLGLLLMTGVTPFSLLCSKTAGKLGNGLMLLLTQLPFTVLAVTLGGIGLDQITAVCVSLTAYMVFLCGISLFASVVAPETRHAFAYAIGGLIFFLGGHLILYLMVNLFGECFYHCEILDWNNPVTKLWDSFSPFVRINQILETGFTGEIGCFQVWSNLATGGLFFFLSWRMFNPFTRSHLSGVSGGWLSRIFSGKQQKFRVIRGGRVWKRALFWKQFHFGTGGWFGFAIRITTYIGILALIVGTNSHRGITDWDDVGAGMAGLALFFFPLELTCIYSSIFNREIHDKTYSSLMLVPMTLPEMVYKMVFGGLAALLPWFVFFTSGFLIYLATAYRIREEEFYIFFAYGTIVLFYVHLMVYLSLYLKHGAFAVAFLLSILSIFFVTFIFGEFLRLRGEALLCFFIFGFGSVTVFLHIQIFHRLRQLAATD